MTIAADPGINKPFDRILKAFADEAPRMLLHLLGVAPLDASVKLKPLPQETSPPVVLPDYVAMVVTALAAAFVFHVEFQLNYYRDLPRTVARYGGSLAWQYLMPVRSVVLLLRRARIPKNIPRTGRYDIGGTRTTHPFRIVRLCDIDPSPILKTNNPRLLPWATLMRSTDAEVREIASVLAKQGDEESIGRFLTLGSLRYDRKRLEDLLGGPRMGLIEAILEGSSLVKEAKDIAAKEGRAAGRAAGRAVGRAEGQINAARRILEHALKAKFPGLEGMPQIAAIKDAGLLESLLLDHVIGASDRGRLEKAILAAARKAKR